ncbi:amino acid ABC transporter [Enterovibrio sp. 27052020O]|uniref:amino acid ABC transporter n=1 Tax=Enterovibrio sp. 27052020O TaxID=3241166 RepID=UPI0038907E70
MSRKNVFASLLFLKPLCILAGLLLSTNAAAWTLDYYVVQDQAEPLQIQDNGKQHRGIVTDILYKALEGTTHELRIHTYPFNRMIVEMTQNQDTNWVSYGSPLWGDMQAANLSSQPLFEVEHSIVSNAKNVLPYHSPNDLDGKIAVLLFGFNYPGLDTKIDKGEVSEVRVKNHAAAFRVVDRLKDTGFFVEMDIRIKYHLKRLGFTNKDYTLQTMNNLIPNYNIHLAYAPGIDPAISNFLDMRLKQMAQNNEIKPIIDSYL